MVTLKVYLNDGNNYLEFSDKLYRDALDDALQITRGKAISKVALYQGGSLRETVRKDHPTLEKRRLMEIMK